MEDKEYISQRMKDFAMNIEELSIGQTVFDSDNTDCLITDKTANSVEVFVRKKTNKGIDCTNWFDMKSFNNRFKTLKP